MGGIEKVLIVLLTQVSCRTHTLGASRREGWKVQPGLEGKGRGVGSLKLENENRFFFIFYVNLYLTVAWNVKL